MTAVRLHDKEDIRVEEVDVPDIGDEELLVRVSSGFICGTDLRMFKHGHASAGDGKSVTLGHELAGTIASVGRSVSGYREEMRVTVDPNMGCGVCDMCVGGNTQLCPELKAIGIHLDGGFAEYVRIPRAAVLQGNVAVLPDSVSFEEAALVEPLSCVLNAAERCYTQPGDVVLVIGAGPIGIMHGKIHRMLGAGRILIHDLSESRLQMCRSLEPDFETVGPDKLREAVAEATGGQGVDVCITAAPSPEAQAEALELMAVNGRLMLFGGLPKDRQIVSMNNNLIHYRQIVVTGTTRQNLRQYRACLDLIAKRTISVGDLITHRYALSEAATAFENAGSQVGLKLGFSAGG